MLVVVAVVLAAALLTHGVLTERPLEVLSAGLLSLLAMASVLGDRWLTHRRDRENAQMPTDAELSEVESDPHARSHVAVGAAEHAATVTSDVVFVAGRTTFHAASCSAVAGRPVGVGDRIQLERAGMTACRRCLP